MKVLSLTTKNYRSLREVTVALDSLNLFIGANASGKSAILDALRFLSEAVQMRSFRVPAYSRGGILNLAWKGEDASLVELAIVVQGEKRFRWSVRLSRISYEFRVTEEVEEIPDGSPPVKLLDAENGKGWWWSGERRVQVELLQEETGCALAAAAADASFPARQLAEYISRWGFFDPSPFLLRRDWNLPEAERLDVYGRNLAETLFYLPAEELETVITATRSIVGLPSGIEPRASEERFYFVQAEPGLLHPVNQMGISSGTLRMLALMTALYAHPEAPLIGVEEPENYIHPSALSAFVQHIISVQDRVQLLVTTHSPLLLDYLDDPAAVKVVNRHETKGTVVLPETNPDGVRRGLEASGFSLGQYHETKGFGG